VTKRRRAKWRRLAGILAALALLAIVTPTGFALAASANRITTVDASPAKSVALVFGAGLTTAGTPTPYLQARLDLAVELFKAGKVRAILVSGDNRRRNHNEPDAMRSYVITQAVPADKVVADYAGFDTYSTCMRANRIFGVTDAIVTTQSYHLARAISTCRAVGIDTWGVGDSTVAAQAEEWQLNSAREWTANIKMVTDFISHRQPVLGEVETSLQDAIKS